MLTKNVLRFRIFALVLILFVLKSEFNAQVENVHIEYDRQSERILVVWGGKIYKDQVVAIATEKGIVMIDAGKAPTLTKEYRRIIEREFGRNDFIYVINTHFHFDHSSGNQVFPEAEIIAHKKTPAMMKEWAAERQNFVDARRTNQMIRWKSQLDNAEPETEQWYRLNDYLTTGNVMLDDYENNFVLTLPDITFNDKMSLALEDITLNLYYFGEGLHTGDDILIHCPEEKLLFSGDLFFHKWFGFAMFPRFEIERWISVLDEIFDNNEIIWIYDNHNSRMTGDFILLLKDYMKDVWKSLLKAKEEGLDFNSINKIYSYENKFKYIDNSGVDVERLKQNHESNL
ncbi:MBL fold metallo-hydrolase [Bacteroidota bacterium]